MNHNSEVGEFSSQDSIMPLVSVVVITFNSSKYVIETLESIKNQTYKNIELIISDDYSSDETKEICLDWLHKYGSNFVRAEFISSENNQGVPANINRGIHYSSGEWIKCIAGDDILHESCIDELISVTKQKEGISVLFSDYIRFYNGDKLNGVIRPNPDNWFCSDTVTPYEQYQLLLRANRVYAATVIIKRSLLDELNGYDEQYKYLEDWPLWIKITEAGYKIFHINKALTYYRIHDSNLSHSKDKMMLFSPMYITSLDFKRKEIIPRLPKIEGKGLLYQIIGDRICIRLGSHGNKNLIKLIQVLNRITNPFSIYRNVLKLFGITYKYDMYLEYHIKW